MEEELEYSEGDNAAAGLTAILEKDESNYYKVNQAQKKLNEIKKAQTFANLTYCPRVLQRGASGRNPNANAAADG